MTVHRDSDPWLIVASGNMVYRNNLPHVPVQAFWVENKAEMQEVKNNAKLLRKIVGFHPIGLECYHRYDIITPNLEYYREHTARDKDPR